MDGAPFGSQGCPRVAPGWSRAGFWDGFVYILMLRGCLSKAFGIALCATHSSKLRHKNVIAVPCDLRAMQIIGQSAVKQKLAGTPGKEKAVAAASCR